MVFNIFSQHLEEHSPPVAGKVASSPSHTILALTPIGAVLMPNCSMPAPPLPQEPSAWGFETPSAKKQQPARSPQADSGVKNLNPALMAAAPAGDYKAGLKEPQPPVVPPTASQPVHLIVPPQPVEPPASPKPVVSGVPGHPAAPVEQGHDGKLAVPGVPVDPAPGAPLAPDHGAANGSNKDGVQKKGKAMGAFKKLATIRIAKKQKKAAQEASGNSGSREPVAEDTLGINPSPDDVPDESTLAAAAMAKEVTAKAKAAPKAKAQAKEVKAKGKAQAQEAKPKAKAKAAPKAKAKAKNVKAQAKTKAKAKNVKAKAKAKTKAEAKATSSSSMMPLKTFAGRYMKEDNEMWEALLHGWTEVSGGNKDERLKRDYWTFVQDFIKDKPGNYHQRIAAACKEWATTPVAVDGKAKFEARMAASKKVAVAAPTKEEVKRKAGRGKKPGSKRARMEGQEAATDLGDEFEEDEDVDDVPAPKTPGAERSEDEGALPLTEACQMHDVQDEGSHEASSGSGEQRLEATDEREAVGEASAAAATRP